MAKAPPQDFLMEAMEKIKEVKLKYAAESKKIDYIESIITQIQSYLLEGTLKHHKDIEKGILDIIKNLDSNIDKAEQLTRKLHATIQKEVGELE